MSRRVAAALAVTTALVAAVTPARAEPDAREARREPLGGVGGKAPDREAAPAPPAAPSPPSPSLPRVKVDASDDQPRCEAAFIERVYKATKPSVVRITRPDGGLGTGFVFFSNRHVATALHVVDLGREVRVEFPGGKQTTAEVVAWDDEHDLAILELDQPTDASPLLARENVAVGAPLLAIGNPYGDLPRFSRELEGLLNFSVSQGIVSAKSDAYIQTDAALSPGNSGGPMLTCDGQVVGVADRLLESRIGFGVPVAHLSRLVDTIGQRRYRGQWTGRDSAIGIAFHTDGSTASYIGPYLGGSLVGYDRLAITTRLGILFAGKGSTSEPVVDRYVRRLFGELVVGYRVLLLPYAFPTYFTLGVGVLGTIDRGEEARLAAANGPPGCVGSACAVTLTTTRTAIRGGGVAPLGNAVLHLGDLEASYGFALDVLHPDYSTHRVLVGLSF